jgi:hypothetical protein
MAPSPAGLAHCRQHLLSTLIPGFGEELIEALHSLNVKFTIPEALTEWKAISLQ